MKKILFAIVACCLAVNAAIAQVPSEITLSEDKPQEEIPISDNHQEHGRIFVRMIGEPDDQGNTSVRIELQNTSNDYCFLLCDHAWDKKELRKSFIYFDKGYYGETTQKIENIGMKGMPNIIEGNSDEKYTFPVVNVGEGTELQVRIPVHLVKPKPGLFCKKRKILYDVVSCTLRITVNTRDRVYENLQMECDSLFSAFNAALDRKEFCSNPKHDLSLEDQAVEYFDERQELESRVGEYFRSCSANSKKSILNESLYDSVHNMKQKMEERLAQYKHDCGGHGPKVPTSCKYCTLSLEDISKQMVNLYFDLYNKDKTKAEVLPIANALYNCCINHKKQVRQWGTSEYKKTIEDNYKSIKNYRP